MREKISATIEDYLEIIYLLERDGEPVIGTRLADLLGVTPPTVTNTLKRMVRDDLVQMDVYSGPHLTQQGREAANAIMRKHMLAEWMLSKMISWSKLHQEAHELEHAISSQVEEALLEEHNHPEVCPHGNPFPGYESTVSAWIPLTKTSKGTRGIIRRIHEFAEGNQDILSFLEERGIVPGQEISIEEILQFNETITVRVTDNLVSLGFAVAHYIFIEPLNKNGG